VSVKSSSSSWPFENIKLYRTIILPVVLYGCETWSLVLGEEHKLRMLKKRGLGKILGLRGARENWNGEDYITGAL